MIKSHENQEFIYHTDDIDDFDKADPSSTQDACHRWTHLNEFSVAKWMECPPGVREVMVSIPVGNSDFFFFPRSCPVDQFTFHV